MMAQNLTRFTLTIVLLGGVLALAITRPQLFPLAPTAPDEGGAKDGIVEAGHNPGSEAGGENALSYEELLAWREELDARQRELDGRAAGLDRREEELESRANSLQLLEENLSVQATLLNEKEREFAAQLAAVRAEQSQLAQERDALHAEKATLAQERADLEVEREHLAQGWDDLQAQRASVEADRASLDEVEASLRAKDAALAELEHTLEGRLRWSVAALVGSGLLAVPSVLVLVTMVRHGWPVPGEQAERTRAAQAHPGKRIPQHGGLPRATVPPTYSGNGRNKRNVGHRV